MAAPLWPWVAGSAVGNRTVNETTRSVTFPTYAVGDLLLILFSNDGSATASATGWTEIKTLLANGAQARLTVLGRIMESGDGTSVTVTTSAVEMSAWIVLRIPNWHGGLTTSSIAVSTGATGLSTSPDPDSLNPESWDVEDTLWLAVYGYDQGQRTTTGYPSGYNRHQLASRSNNSAGCGVACAAKYNAVASEDPGAFTLSAADDWAAITLAIRPTATTDVVPLSWGIYQPSVTTTPTSLQVLPTDHPFADDEQAILLTRIEVAGLTIDGFTQVDSRTVGSARFAIWRRTLTGSDTGSRDLSADSSAVAQIIGYRIANSNPGSVEVALADANSATPDPPNLTLTGWDDSEVTLWIAGAGFPTRTVSAYPGSYSPAILSTLITSAHRRLAANAENPGTFTLSTAADWIAATVAVRTLATGATEHFGTIDTDFGALTATAVGLRETFGTVATDFGGLSATAAGTRETVGTISTDLGALTATAVCVRETAGFIATDLGPLAATAIGVRETFGFAINSLGGLTATVIGLRETFGFAFTDLGPLTATAIGTVDGNLNGTIDTDFGPLTATAIGVRETFGFAFTNLGALTATVTGNRETFAFAFTDLGPLTATVIGTVEHFGSIATDFGSLTATAIGTISSDIVFPTPLPASPPLRTTVASPPLRTYTSTGPLVVVNASPPPRTFTVSPPLRNVPASPPLRTAAGV